MWYHTSMSAYETDSRIDDYIVTLPGWQQEICRQVRDLVHAADPEVTETVKRTRQPYFLLHGNICALLGAKDHLNKSGSITRATVDLPGGRLQGIPYTAEIIGLCLVVELSKVRT